jgi:hypothetical protein
VSVNECCEIESACVSNACVSVGVSVNRVSKRAYPSVVSCISLFVSVYAHTSLWSICVLHTLAFTSHTLLLANCPTTTLTLRCMLTPHIIIATLPLILHPVTLHRTTPHRTSSHPTLQSLERSFRRDLNNHRSCVCVPIRWKLGRCLTLVAPKRLYDNRGRVVPPHRTDSFFSWFEVCEAGSGAHEVAAHFERLVHDPVSYFFTAACVAPDSFVQRYRRQFCRPVVRNAPILLSSDGEEYDEDKDEHTESGEREYDEHDDGVVESVEEGRQQSGGFWDSDDLYSSQSSASEEEGAQANEAMQQVQKQCRPSAAAHTATTQAPPQRARDKNEEQHHRKEDRRGGGGGGAYSSESDSSGSE